MACMHDGFARKGGEEENKTSRANEFSLFTRKVTGDVFYHCYCCSFHNVIKQKGILEYSYVYPENAFHFNA